MSAGDLATVLVVLLAFGAFIVLLVALQSLVASLRELRRSLDVLHDETVPLLAGVAQHGARRGGRGRPRRPSARRGGIDLGDRRLGHAAQLPRLPGTAAAIRGVLQGHRAVRRPPLRAQAPAACRVAPARRSIGGRHDPEAGVLVRGRRGLGLRGRRLRLRQGARGAGPIRSRPSGRHGLGCTRRARPEPCAPRSTRRWPRVGTRCTKPNPRSAPRSNAPPRAGERIVAGNVGPSVGCAEP